MKVPSLTDEAKRLAALHRLQILDTPREPLYDEMAELAAQICDVPVAAITLIDDRRQWFKSIVGLALEEIPRDLSLCVHTIFQDGLLQMPDLQVDPRSQFHPFVIGEPNMRFYAGIALVTSEHQALGTLCVVDYKPRVLTESQQNSLRILAQNISAHLELRQQDLEHKQRQAAEETARDNAALLAQAQRIAGIGNWKMDVETGDRHWSEQMYHLLDFDPALSLPPVSDVLARFAPDDAREIRLLLQQAITEVVPYSADVRVILRDGSTRWHHIAAHPVTDSQGRCVEVVGILHDITERKHADRRLTQAEEKYRKIFSNAAYGIYQATPHGSLVSVNPAMAQMLGYASPDEMLLSVTNIAQEFCEEQAERRVFNRKIREGTPTLFESRTRRKDGETLWLAVRGSAITDESGKTVYYEGSVEDITSRKMLEADRESLLDQTEQLLADALERADCDPLTGLLNHRAFHRRLQEEADRSQRLGQSLGVALLDLKNFKFFNDAYGHLSGDEVLRLVARSLQNVCRSYDTVARFGGDEFAVLLPGAAPADKTASIQRLTSAAAQVNFLPPGHATPIPLSLSVGMAFFPADAAGRMDVLALADEELLRRKTGAGENGDAAASLSQQLSLTKSGFTMLHALVTAVDNKDRYTRHHSEDVMAYSLQIARILGLDTSVQQTIAIAALLHDVGKIGVPDAILRKPGALTDLEFEAMREHPMMGSIIVGAVPGFEEMLDAVRHHHERWDGGGYPFGLSGEETPLLARLMAVADAFSAMTTHRPYRKGMPQEKALTILQSGAGTQWDPKCVEAFVQSLLVAPPSAKERGLVPAS